MAKVKCINNTGVEGTLKLDHQYQIIGELNDKYIVITGNGVKAYYLKSRFERND